jgi:hypothetical protein
MQEAEEVMKLIKEAKDNKKPFKYKKLEEYS